MKTYKKLFLFAIIFFFHQNLFSQTADSVEILIKTFRGNEQRNFYGNEAPSKLRTIWKLSLGSGISVVKDVPRMWTGAGWTGQPLLFRENGKLYLIQGAYDYNLRKVDALNGKVIWTYKFDDIIKGTGTIWENPNPEKPQNRFVIMQGSRYGAKNNWEAKVIPSFRAISLLNGKELWRMNVRMTYSYSRDVDASALVLNDTAYIGLENGIFTLFNPDYKYATVKDSILQPKIYREFKLFNDSDVLLHGMNFVTESSPTLLNNRIYIGACSRILGYNLETKKLDWNFYIATDIDGTVAATKDNKLLVTIERQYVEGKGGVLKLDPSKPEKDAVDWFFPTENRQFAEWEGGIIGTIAVNDYYIKNNSVPSIAAFSAIDGYLYVIDCNAIDETKKVKSPDLRNEYPTPKLLYKYLIGPGISSPVIVGNKIVACSSGGILLFEYAWVNGKFTVKVLDRLLGVPIEASPIVWNKRIYIASRNGYLYCLGE